jgi:hypothetical protein
VTASRCSSCSTAAAGVPSSPASGSVTSTLPGSSSSFSARASRSGSFRCVGESSWPALRTYLGEPLEFVDRRPEPDDYLLYPEKRTPDRRVYWAEPKKPCAYNTVHRWWYRMLEQAGLVGHGFRSGLNMHTVPDTRSRPSCAASPASRPPRRRSATATSRPPSASPATRTSAGSSARWRRSPRRARPKKPRAGGTIRPPGSTECCDLQERWRRRESNPRPRPHRAERLQA